MAKTSHAHKFRRHTYKTGAKVYFCALPDCSIKMNPSLTLGKRAICWRCEEEFVMSEYSIRLAKPHCDNCHKSKDMISIPIVVRIDMPNKEIELSNPISDLQNRLASLTPKDEDI